MLRISFYSLVVICVALLQSVTLAHPIEDLQQTKRRHLQCLVTAYSDYIQFADETKLSVLGVNNKLYPYDYQAIYDSFEEELDKADLQSQMRQTYPLGNLQAPPVKDFDPGRLRYTPLFHDMYGKTKKEAAVNLVPVRWAPCDCNINFSRVNGAANALEQVGKKINDAGLSSYVKKSLGTFNWRKIAGTQRLSMHSFGIAIDFELPKNLGQYWKWDKNHKSNGFPLAIISDQKLNQVVNIFEQHGFIWGGKWWHYDSIHFEYRPELTHPACSTTS